MKYRLTVVEDNAVDLVLWNIRPAKLALVLEINSFSDGETARNYIQLGQDEDPHLFLFDSTLPRIGGLELLQLLSN